MTGVRSPLWGVRLAALLVGAVALVGCGDLLFEDPAPAITGVALDIKLAPPASSSGRIMAQVEYDQVRVKLLDHNETLVDERTVNISAPGQDARVQFEVQIEAETASYTVTVELLAEGRIVGSGSAAIQVERGVTTPVNVDIDAEGRVVLLPEQQEGQTRIVLTWGVTPSDLDSHLVGPDGQGGSFHVYYSNRGSLDQSPFVVLDTDDTSSYGPETITIGQQFEGTYCYYVYQFSSSGILTASEATVKVYQNNDLAASYNVPTSGDGRYWTVFTMNGSSITAINSVGTAVQCPQP